MIKCSKCGKENVDEAIFCSDCGTKLDILKQMIPVQIVFGLFLK